MRFVVATADLRLALKSVGPHVDPDPDFAQLHRIRIVVGPENVTVSATNRYTIGHALVSLWDNEDGELGLFDLSPQDAKEILALFPGKKSAGEDIGDSLRLEVTKDYLVVTDISGLFAGKALTLPRYQTEENFPDVAQLVAGKLLIGGELVDRLVTSGELLALFVKATAAYKEPLVIDPHGAAGAMLITCGESFIGVLMPIRPDDERIAQINAWHGAWQARFAEQGVELAT